MGEKIVLIDGHSILNRAFYGLPDLTNSEGLHTNAIYVQGVQRHEKAHGGGIKGTGSCNERSAGGNGH